MIAQFGTKGIKITARNQPVFAKTAYKLLFAVASLGGKSG
jgi:hypothetical protein